MRRDEFETRVLQLYTTTRIPLTRVNLQLMTGAAREKLEAWLDELTRAGALELDSDDEGTMMWKVPGARRAAKGASDIGEWQRLEALKSTLPAPAGKSGGVVKSAVPDEKSLLASAGLSFVLGPFGWLYAAPVVDAVAGIVVWSILHAVLPSFLFFWLLGLMQPLAAILGALYAWQYNKNGARTSVKDMGSDDDGPRKLLK